MSQEEPRRVSLAEARAARAGRPEVAVAYEQTLSCRRRSSPGGKNWACPSARWRSGPG
jgi:hypothetical protein